MIQESDPSVGEQSTYGAALSDSQYSYPHAYVAAFDRTERFGLSVPPRTLVLKDCVDRRKVIPAVIEYFERHTHEELIGQIASSYFDLWPRLVEATGVPLELTIGWIDWHGKPCWQHDESFIRMFLTEKTAAWAREGMPFHLWLTSPACEIVDLTFSLNCGWAKNPNDCERFLIYRSPRDPLPNPVYHPTVVGGDFFEQSGGLLDF